MTRLGMGSFLGLGLYTPYTKTVTGSDIAFYVRVEGGEIGLQHDVTRLQFDNIDTYDHRTDLIKTGQKAVSGTLTFKLDWKSLPDLLRMIFHHSPSYDSPTGTFTFSTRADLTDTSGGGGIFLGSTTRAILAEVFAKDEDSGTPNSQYYTGLLITQAQLTFEPNGYLMVQLSVLGRDLVQADRSTATPTYTGQTLIATPTGQSSPALLLSLGGTTHRANSVVLTIDQVLEHNFDVIDQIAQVPPVPTAKRNVSITADIEAPALDATILDKIADPTSVFSTGVIHLVDGTKSILLTARDLSVEAGGEPRSDGIGIVRSALSMKAHYDGTNPVLTAVIDTDTTDYIQTLPV